MRVSFASEPAPGVANDDFVFALTDLVCVLDGVTAPPELNTGCTHGTPWYVRRLAARIGLAYADTPQAPLGNLISSAIEMVRVDHGGRCDLSHPGTPSSTVCMLRNNGHSVDWLVLSDSPLVLGRHGKTEAITDHRLKQTSIGERQAVAAGRAPLGTPEHRAQVLALVEAQRPYRNKPGGYWLAAATPDAGEHAITGSASLDGEDALTHAALLTDGASRAVDKFRLYDWSGFLGRLEKYGPTSVIDDVRGAEMADPLGIRYPRGKTHDDATIALALF